MGFGESVSSLLETYDNCLALLKAFKRSNKQKDSRKISKASEQQALLRRSLRTNRRKVERAYSSRVSESGSNFVKGDSKARSALSKVLRRLNAAIANLMRLVSKSSKPLMDYQSLMSLSNTSRIQTIKTFDQLSRRLSSKSSRGSVVSAATSDSPKSSKSSRTAKSSTLSKDRKHKTAKLSKSQDSNNERKPTGNHHSGIQHTDPPRLESSIATPLLDAMEDRNSSLRRRSSLMDRFSLISISSTSTKLGEIPERRWRGRPDGLDGRLDEYNAPIVYPLRPYQPVVKERRFMGLFRRG